MPPADLGGFTCDKCGERQFSFRWTNLNTHQLTLRLNSLCVYLWKRYNEGCSEVTIGSLEDNSYNTLDLLWVYTLAPLYQTDIWVMILKDDGK